MNFTSDPDQQYQIEILRSVADLFDGEPFIRWGMVFKNGTVALSTLANRRNPRSAIRNCCRSMAAATERLEEWLAGLQGICYDRG